MNPFIIYLFLFFCLYPEISFSQEDTVNKYPFIYGEFGIDMGDHYGTKLALNYIWENNIACLAFYHTRHDASDIPPDYTKPFIHLFNDGLPHQQIYMWSPMYGKVLFAEDPRVRYVLKGGIVAGFVKTPHNYTESSGLISNSWTYTYNKQEIAGIILNPAIEFPLSPYFGLSVDAFANLNTVNNYYGVGVNMIFGEIRNGRNKHLPQ